MSAPTTLKRQIALECFLADYHGPDGKAAFDMLTPLGREPFMALAGRILALLADGSLRAGVETLAKSLESIEFSENLPLLNAAVREDHAVAKQLRTLLQCHPAEEARELPDPPFRTFCAECGPNVAVDEEGCCLSCGSQAFGAGLDRLNARLTRPEPSSAGGALLRECEQALHLLLTYDVASGRLGDGYSWTERLTIGETALAHLRAALAAEPAPQAPSTLEWDEAMQSGRVAMAPPASEAPKARREGP